MRIEIPLPRLAESMTAANVLVWRKHVGEIVQPGDVLVEVETDKSSVELEASAPGILAEIAVPEGSENVPVGAVLGWIEPTRPEPATAMRAPVQPAPAPRQTPASVPGATAPPAAPTPSPAVTIANIAGDGGRDEGSIAATPLARRMAAQGGVSLAGLRGSGIAGRITKADVEAALGLQRGDGAPTPAPAAAAPPVPAPETDTPFRELRHSAARRAQASRLAEAKRTIPHFYLFLDCDVGELQALRVDLDRHYSAKREAGITLNDLFVRAAALALRAVPEANVSWTEAALRQYERVDLCVAVASERGLVTPVVRDADRKPLALLAAELRDLTARARAGRLRPEEYQGGTCTISNLGMYGVESLIPILNPPQSCILGLGAAEPRAVARDGAVVVRTMLTCTLAADHRALDGAIGARFLNAFREFVEGPLALVF
jgi:pyruvate dehydrogenase E2 component (dihydrolipoamide acetyltransferase)